MKGGGGGGPGGALDSDSIYMSSEEERARVNRELAMASQAAEEDERQKKNHLDHSRTCVFTALTNQVPVTSSNKVPSDVVSDHPNSSHSASGALVSGDTYVIRKKQRGSSSLSEPASRSTYIAIQKGHDIPLSGLQKPAPSQVRQNKGKNHFLLFLSFFLFFSSCSLSLSACSSLGVFIIVAL